MVDTRTYLMTLRTLVEEGHEVSMLITGSSMSPFLIHQRDSIYFGKPHRALKKGDMVFYQRTNGDFVIHRIRRVAPEGYYLIGDAQTVTEGPVSASQIFALILKVKRKGKWIEPGSFLWEFFARVWINLIPLRRIILQAYGLLKNSSFQ